jgi:UDP-N-acetylglucosamine 2-epimerase (non-hydrolysing)
MKIDLIVGARPNFVKAAAILHAAREFPQHEFTLVHTGQHHDIMSDPYFRDLQLPKPNPARCIDLRDFDTPIDRLSQMIHRLRDIYNDTYPDAVLVVGDTDSTLAGALSAAKMGIPVIHVEAGLRTWDGIQEDTNRILVDAIAKKHYTTSDFADNNLAAEGKKGIQVGNVMVDTLTRFLPFAMRRFRRDDKYAVVTLHRAENVDDSFRCNAIISAINNIGALLPVIWPIHPRMKKYECMIAKFIHTVPPMGYLEFIATLAGAEFVVTDSGGVQEETTALGIPCFTVRERTERPETIWRGSNTLVPHPGLLYHAVQSTIRQFPPSPYKEGSAAKRIMEDLCETSF